MFQIAPAVPIIWLYRVYTLLLKLALKFLPHDPFTPIIEGLGTFPGFETFVGWLNWCIPMGFIISSFEAFLGVYVTYIYISAIMRFLKVFGG